MAPPQNGLASHLRSNSPVHNAKGTQSGAYDPKAAPPSYRLYADGFRIFFTPRTGVLFTFPSRYLFTIGHQVVFSLTPWSGQILAKFHVFRDTWESKS